MHSYLPSLSFTPPSFMLSFSFLDHLLSHTYSYIYFLLVTSCLFSATVCFFLLTVIVCVFFICVPSSFGEYICLFYCLFSAAAIWFFSSKTTLLSGLFKGTETEQTHPSANTLLHKICPCAKEVTHIQWNKMTQMLTYTKHWGRNYLTPQAVSTVSPFHSCVSWQELVQS